MQLARENDPQSDDELLTLAANGDPEAFAAIYERHFDGVYDFAVRTVRDPDSAADVVRSAFTEVWECLQRGRSDYNLGPWLYVIARKNAVDVLHRKGSIGNQPRDGRLSEEAQIFAKAGPSGDQTEPEDGEIIAAVWSSVAVLSPKQYTLLDMHLRRGFSADELAESLHFTQNNTYTMLKRLRDALSQSVSVRLLMARGRRECRQLDHLLSEIEPAGSTRKVRRVIDDHLKECDRCRANKRRYPSPLEVFRHLALVPAGPGVQAGIWREVWSHINGVPVVPGRLMHPLSRAPARKSVPLAAAAIAGVAGLIAILLASVLVFGSSGGGGAATVQDPTDVHAADREAGAPSTDNTIEVEWTAPTGVQAYSIDWTQGPQDLPDTEADLPGTATATESPPLAPGTWYFHLRTQGDDDRWTSTVHLGPFEIIEDETPVGTATPTPSPEASETLGPTPQFPTLTPLPQTETPAPTPEPTAAPTLTPTPTPPPATATPTPTDGTPSPTLTPS